MKMVMKETLRDWGGDLAASVELENPSKGEAYIIYGGHVIIFYQPRIICRGGECMLIQCVCVCVLWAE